MNNVVIMLHHTATGASGNVAQLCAMYGYTLHRIDLVGDMPIGPTVSKGLDEALLDPRWVNWNWTFFDALIQPDKLSTFVHQRTNAVYVFGSDLGDKGWDRPLDALPGALVAIDSDLGDGFSHTAAHCAEAVIIHRYYQVDVP